MSDTKAQAWLLKPGGKASPLGETYCVGVGFFSACITNAASWAESPSSTEHQTEKHPQLHSPYAGKKQSQNTGRETEARC